MTKSPASPTEKPLLIGLPPVFSNLPSWYADRLAEVGVMVNLRKGEMLKIGRQADGFAGIPRSGILYLRTFSSVQDDTGVVSEFFRTGQFITVPSGQCIHRVFAASDASVVGVPYPLFMARLDQAPVELLRWEMQQVHERLMRKDFDRLASRTLRPEARLASLYWNLSEPLEGGDRQVTAKIPQAIIAEYLGISREEVSRKKSLLEKSGIVQERGRTLILDKSLPLIFSMFTETAESYDGSPTQHNGSPLHIPPVSWLLPDVNDGSTPVPSIHHPPAKST